MKSRIVDVIIPCEVFYEEAVDKSYGADADGNRGMTIMERIPTSVAILELVPQEAVKWLKEKAIDQFNEQFNK